MSNLLIVNDFPPIIGGQSAYYFALCQALAKKGITVLAPAVKRDFSRFDSAQAFTIVRKPFLTQIPILEKVFKIILPVFYAFPIIRKNQIKNLHCGHILTTGITGCILKRLTKCRYFIYTHSADVLEYQRIPLMKALLTFLLKDCDHIFANSNFTRNCLTALGIPENKTTIVFPRVDVKKMTPPKDITPLLDAHSLRGKRVILSINRMVERKGNDMVIRALPAVIEKFPNVIYIVAGNGPRLDYLRELTKTTNVEANVLFLPANSPSQIRDLLYACDLFIMPSRYIESKGDVEGFGVVFLEAGSCGKPVIGGNSGGIPDSINDGKTGFLVDPLDPQDIARKILLLLSDPDLAKQMGEAGKERVLAQFDVRHGIPEMEFLFTE